MRNLWIIPIVHSAADLGKLEPDISRIKAEASGDSAVRNSRKAIEQFWADVDQRLEGDSRVNEETMIFQDALPVVPEGQEALLLKIVNEMATHGSQNHQLLKKLLGLGAQLVGTESAEYLVEEYRLIREIMAASVNADTQLTADLAREMNSEAMVALLEKRDRFIGERISSQLGEDRFGILFIGIAHAVERFLAEDIQVEYPIGRPNRFGESISSNEAANVL
ncbi:MAG: hypothetical protein MUD03_00575 [Pirellula sp.]|jgi:hypothetical protein|nr:hypothetical protein [Pirellula sp.]